MNWADWAILGVLTLSSVISLVRGFVKEALSLLIWILALIAANVFSRHVETLLTSFISTPSIRAISAFALVFIGVLALGALINYGIGLMIKASGLSGTDRFLGMLFGAVRGILIIMVLLIYVPNYIPIKSDPWYRQSVVIPYFVPFETTVENATNEITRWTWRLMNSSENSKN